MITPEGFLQAARNYSSGHTQGQAAKEYVENLPKTCDTLGRSLPWSTLDNLCTQFTGSPEEQCTIGLLGALYAKTKSPDFNTQFEPFLVQFARSIESDSTDYQSLRAGSALVSGACEAISDQVIRRKNPILAINLMRSVIRRIQKGPRQLTGVHATLLQLCLSSHCLKPALPYLMDDIDDFSSDLKGGDCKQVLLYFYYGGMVYTALKKYAEAIFFFEACTRVPAQTLSHIMLEAYKKFVLVSLIQLGEVPPPHKSALQVVNRILKPSAQPYTDLVTAFLTHNPGEVVAAISRNQEVFRRDNNFGLVKQVRAAQTKLNIQRLTKTFLTLSLADVAARVQLSSADEAEKCILSMIQDGEIYAKISQLDGMVVFLDDNEKYDNPKVLGKVESQISRCIDLNKRLSEMNERLATNPEFISRVMLTGSGGIGTGSSLGLGDDQDMAVSATASSSSASTSRLPSSFNH
ncbi:COP9 signalosome complex subunit 3 isoform X2 [Folsomia candida]|uniref:COP9 signalosome complex subunit 3 isoform X2 n=1 Tax=Folsomia candida TaxID=158441 RepID=UPI000B8FB49D|nr:COP9 signalosome complex subunit 3 isoform X2 [Folsomia candida]